MNRPIRIGLIAEGQTELGPSVPYVKPEDGGKLIPKERLRVVPHATLSIEAKNQQ